MAFIEGSLAFVEVDGTGVGGLNEASISLSASELETTVHGSSSAAEWKTFISGRKEGTMSLSCLFDDSDAGQLKIIQSYDPSVTGVADSLGYVLNMGSGGSADTYTANGIVTDLSYGTPNDGVATLDVTVRLTALVTIA